MKIGLIGGAGFIGTRIADLLTANNIDYVIIDKEMSSVYSNKSIKCDIRDLDALVNACSECNILVNLAAEHRDDVKPISLYTEVNVKGSENICIAAETNSIHYIIFASSVAVYGFSDEEKDEKSTLCPFNEYGRTKMIAEQVFKKWYEKNNKNSLVIIRPTVVFGEGNRGNVYNLLKQIAKNNFIMIGSGRNRKSMAYVGNVASFFVYMINNRKQGIQVYNYIDKPDYSMNVLVSRVHEIVQKNRIPLRIPYPVAYSIGIIFDVLGKILNKNFSISSIRVKKFCSPSIYSSMGLKKTDFNPPYMIDEGLTNTINHEFKK